jgi:hypothetical protein
MLDEENIKRNYLLLRYTIFVFFFDTSVAGHFGFIRYFFPNTLLPGWLQKKSSAAEPS